MKKGSPLYQPTKEQQQEAKVAMTQASLMIGRFVVAWSELETRLRVLELMATDGSRFRPIEDLDNTDLIATKRFMERVRKVVPASVKVGQDGVRLRDWFKHADQVRNRIVHGAIIFHSGKDDNVSVPVVVHCDMVATLMAGKGFPEVTQAQIPNHKNSLNPGTMISLAGLDPFIKEVEQVRNLLTELIGRTHGIDIGGS